MTPYLHIIEALYNSQDLYRAAKLGGKDREADMHSAVMGLMEQARARIESEWPPGLKASARATLTHIDKED